MENDKGFYGMNFIKLLLNFFRVVFFLTALGCIVWATYSIFIFLTDSPTRHMAFPVIFKLQSEGILNIPDITSEANFYILHTRGLLVSDTIPKDFLGLFSILQLLMISSILLIFRLTIRILDTALLGRFLMLVNAIRLRHIALLGIVYFILEHLMTLISAHYFSDKLEYSNVSFTELHLFSWFNLNVLLTSLFLLVIAEAFRIGARLKEENDLTI